MAQKLAVCATICILVVGGVFAVQFVTAQPPTSTATQQTSEKSEKPGNVLQPTTPEVAPPSDPVMADILQQRRNRKSSLLEGTVLESAGDAGVSDEREFLDQLNQIAADPEKFGVNISDRVFFDGVPESSFVPALRAASFALDRRAHDCECLRDYKQADRLRGLAASIRAEARLADE